MALDRAMQLVRNGIAAARAGDTAGARVALRQAVTLDPGIETGWLWLAGVTDDPAEAIGHLERVLQLNPKNETARTGIEQLRTRLPADRFFCPICLARAAERFTTCLSCRSVLDLARPDAALAAAPPDMVKVRDGAVRLATVVREQPDFFAHYYLGMAHLNLGRLAEAVAQFRAAQRLRPNDVPFAQQLAALEDALADAAPPTKRIDLHSQAPKPQGRPRDPRKSVLVVDDSPIVRRLVTLTMQKKGYRVVEAADGEEALEQVRYEGPPDVVLLDATMPGMDGATLCRQLRQDPANAQMPVVFLSGRDGTMERARGKSTGPNRFLPKPFEPAALVNMVRECCPTGGG
jgi:twitching motility two-component system response regulator PilG